MKFYERVKRHFRDNIVNYSLAVTLAALLNPNVNTCEYSARAKESAEQWEHNMARLDTIGQAYYRNLLESQVADSSLTAPRDSLEQETQ